MKNILKYWSTGFVVVGKRNKASHINIDVAFIGLCNVYFHMLLNKSYERHPPYTNVQFRNQFANPVSTTFATDIEIHSWLGNQEKRVRLIRNANIFCTVSTQFRGAEGRGGRSINIAGMAFMTRASACRVFMGWQTRTGPSSSTLLYIGYSRTTEERKKEASKSLINTIKLFVAV